MKNQLCMIPALIIFWTIASPGLAQQAEQRPKLSDDDLAAWKKIAATERWITPMPWGVLEIGNTPSDDSWHGFGFGYCRRLAHFDKNRHLKSLDEVAVPSVPFALSIHAEEDDLKKLQRFRDRLQVLVIRDDRIQCNSGIGDYAFLKPLSQLRMLACEDLAYDSLFQAISSHEGIVSLHVNGRWVTDAGLAELAKMKQLKTLSLVGAGQITPAGAKEIAQLSNLRSLRLERSAINDEALAALTALTDLESLHLGTTRITDAGADSLAQFKHLRTLVLSSTKLTEGAITKLAELKELRELDLSDVYLKKTAVDDLARMSNLEKLHLRLSEIEQEALRRLKVKTIIWTPRHSSGAKRPERDRAQASQTIWNGRTLEEWFQDATTRLGEEGAQLRAEEAQEQLIAAAAEEPDVCRVALRHVGGGYAAVENRLRKILAVSRESASLAVYERLSDEADDKKIDPWCIQYLREQKDASPEAIAALVACLHSKNQVGGAGDAIPKLAADRLGEIGMPALDAVLKDRLRGVRAPRWNHGSLELMGVKAADRVLEHSLVHPDDFLDNVLATYCRDNAAEVAPKLLAVLADEMQSNHHALVLATLATAGETYYRDRKRIDPILKAEGVVSAALPYLKQKETYVSGMKIVAGWRPHPEGTREQIVAAFNAGHNNWLAGVKALGTLDELPVEVAERLFQLHEKVNPPLVSHWQVALGKLSAAGKEKIKPALRASATTSPGAAVGLATVDASDQTRIEVRAILGEMKRKPELRQRIEAYLKFARNL